MNNRIKLWQTRYQKWGNLVKDFATWTWNMIEKALIVGGWLLWGYNHHDIILKFEKTFWSSERLNDYPKTWVVVSAIGCAILGNLIAKWAIKWSKAGYNYLTDKKNIISRSWAASLIIGNNSISWVDLSVDKNIINTRIDNLNDSKETIDNIIKKIEHLETDLKTIETTIDTNINDTDTIAQEEVKNCYAGNDLNVDIQGDQFVAKDQYFTTPQYRGEIIKMEDKKIKKKDIDNIVNNYLPKIRYIHNGTDFVSSGEYFIGTHQIWPWLKILQDLQDQFIQELSTISNKWKAPNLSKISINQLDQEMNSGAIKILWERITQHISDLGLNKIKYKERWIENSLATEIKILEQSFKNSQDQSKTLLQKLWKKVWL